MPDQNVPRPRRQYRLVRRGEQAAATADRIARAAFELHATIGPARTTISAVAERAGVQRHTVYHHFPDMTSLFRACTEHGMRITGTPDATPWRAIDDPIARLRAALPELYAYYRANARLLGNVSRDMPLVADVGGFEAFTARMGELYEALASGWADGPGLGRLRMAAIAHAMAFETWHSLADAGLSDEEAAGEMVRFVSEARAGHSG
jgi:AcrR family transcriptional regulator